MKKRKEEDFKRGSTTNLGNVSAEYLRQYVERIEKLEEEKAGLGGDIRDAYGEAKANGFDPKILRQVIAIRKKDKNEVDEQRHMLDLYMGALGMLPLFDRQEQEAA